MRQVISTAVVAVIVGALAGATMSAVAQAPAEQAITPAAGINAATVDGKSAVGYTNKKRARRGKLVATNRQGELPSNIVRPFWGYIKNTPAGFADGVDDGTDITITKVFGPSLPLASGAEGYAFASCPAGSTVIGGGFTGDSYDLDVVASLSAAGDSTWAAAAKNNTPSARNLFAFAVCMSTHGGDITTATEGPKPSRIKSK